jgi:hypothetical protein
LRTSLGSLVMGLGTGYPFSSFPTKTCVWIIFFEDRGFHPFFPSLNLMLCNYDLDRLIGGFNCLFSFPWFNFCVVTYLVVS